MERAADSRDDIRRVLIAAQPGACKRPTRLSSAQQLYGQTVPITDYISRAAMHLSRGANRDRVRGGRVQVCAVIACRRPAAKVLLVKSVYGDWMFPQEGVRLSESLEDALHRGLLEELGVPSRSVTVRAFERLGRARLPTARQGERQVADDVLDGPLSTVVLRFKCYWAAYAIVDDASTLPIVPNQTEVVGHEWLPLDQALDRIRVKIGREKLRAMTRALTRIEQHLDGR